MLHWYSLILFNGGPWRATLHLRPMRVISSILISGWHGSRTTDMMPARNDTSPPLLEPPRTQSLLLQNQITGSCVCSYHTAYHWDCTPTVLGLGDPSLPSPQGQPPLLGPQRVHRAQPQWYVVCKNCVCYSRKKKSTWRNFKYNYESLATKHTVSFLSYLLLSALSSGIQAEGTFFISWSIFLSYTSFKPWSLHFILTEIILRTP